MASIFFRFHEVESTNHKYGHETQLQLCVGRFHCVQYPSRQIHGCPARCKISTSFGVREEDHQLVREEDRQLFSARISIDRQLRVSKYKNGVRNRGYMGDMCEFFFFFSYFLLPPLCYTHARPEG